MKTPRLSRKLFIIMYMLDETDNKEEKLQSTKLMLMNNLRFNEEEADKIIQEETEKLIKRGNDSKSYLFSSFTSIEEKINLILKFQKENLLNELTIDELYIANSIFIEIKQYLSKKARCARNISNKEFYEEQYEKYCTIKKDIYDALSNAARMNYKQYFDGTAYRQRSVYAYYIDSDEIDIVQKTMKKVLLTK